METKCNHVRYTLLLLFFVLFFGTLNQEIVSGEFYCNIMQASVCLEECMSRNEADENDDCCKDAF